MARYLYALVVLLGFCSGPVQAETIRTPTSPFSFTEAQRPDTPPMRVIIVRSGETGCEPNCPEWISAEGRITAETPALFERAFAAMAPRKLPILVASNGGVIESALRIGRMIRERHLDVAISATWLQPCLQADKRCRDDDLTGRLGEPHGNAASCASACVFLLAAGERRIVSYDVGVGLHEASETTIHKEIEHIPVVDPLGRLVRYRSKVLSSYSTEGTPSETIYAKSAAYFRQMGIRGDLVTLMHKASSDEIHWMTIAELDSTGLATNRFSPEAFIDALGHPAHALLEPPLPSSGWTHQQASTDHWQDGQIHPAVKNAYAPVKDPPITIITLLPSSYTQLHPDWPVPAMVFDPRPLAKPATEKIASTDLPKKGGSVSPPQQPRPAEPKSERPAPKPRRQQVAALVPAAPPKVKARNAPPKGVGTEKQSEKSCEEIRTIPAAGMHLTGRVIVVLAPGTADLVLAQVEHQLHLQANPKYFDYERVGVVVDGPNMFGMRQSVLIPGKLRAVAGDEITFVTRHQDTQPCRFIPNLATSVRRAG
jgi:hypothetical protein